MEAPPNFAPAGPPPKKSNALLYVVLGIVGICALCCVGFLVFGLNMFNKFKGTIGCLTHYESVRFAFRDYADAHDGKLPPADTWQDAIVPYYGKHGRQSQSGSGIIDFGDPSKDLGCPAENGAPATGMAFNSDLAEKTVAEAKKSPSTVLVYEVPQTGRNLHGPYKPQPGRSPLKFFGQPRDWITEPVSGALNVNPEVKSGNTSGANSL